MIQHQQTPVSTPAASTQTMAAPALTGLVSPFAMQITSPLYHAPVSGPGGAPPGLFNWKGDPVLLPPHHIMSPVDLPMDQKPIFTKGPFTTEQKERFRKGTGAGLKMAPHHRHQLPVSMGGVIDEIPGPGHPDGNQHTTGKRHPNKTTLFLTKYSRNKEIRKFWQDKALRLVEDPPGSGQWYDKGV